MWPCPDPEPPPVWQLEAAEGEQGAGEGGGSHGQVIQAQQEGQQDRQEAGDKLSPSLRPGQATPGQELRRPAGSADGQRGAGGQATTPSHEG